MNDSGRLQHKIDDLENECRRLGKDLRESKERFHKIFHASSNMITISTIKDGKMIDVNEASASLGGYNREELIGTVSAEMHLWANPKERDFIMRKIQKEGRVSNVPVDMLAKNGEIRRVLFSADPIVMNNEPCLLGVCVDITTQKNEADILRHSEEKYRMLVENSLQGLAIIQDQRIVFCNTAFAQPIGYSVEELTSLADLKTIIHPEDRETVVARYHERMEGKAVPRRYEYRVLRKDGSVSWQEVLASRIEYNGEPAAQIVHVDITERINAEEALKESREYYNQIINRIGDPVFVRDRNHRFTLVNDALCAFMGRQREELLGNTFFEFLPPEQAASMSSQEEEVFETGNENVTEDLLPDLHGNPHNILTKKSLFVQKNGQKQIVGILRDITEYKQLEEQLLQAQKMEAIAVLAGGVAHDFNNLLNVINGYSELLLESLPEEDPKRKDLEQIKEAGLRAATLTSRLLAFGRKQILQPEILNLNDVIENISTMLRRLIREDIQLDILPQPGLGKVYADPGQIQQVIMNLSVNARDAMPLGGELIIETANVDFDTDYVANHPETKVGSYIMLAISDNGTGMSAETKSRLFEPFYTTKERGKGTGLGLPTVYGIVKQSGGFIWVYSEPGKGSTFKVYLPRVEGQDERLRSEGTEAIAFQGCETVLIVEDETAVRTLISRILRDQGYTVLVASNGMEALRISREYKSAIHLILTDVVMPGMRGTALASRIQTERPDIKALFISGYTDNGVVHNGALDPEVAFLQKPFTVEGMARKVWEVLHP